MRIALALFLVLSGAQAGEMTIICIDSASGAPVPGARIEASVDGSLQAFTTGAQGRGALSLPHEGLKYGLHLTVSAEGRVPLMKMWDAAADLPAEFTFRLQQGTTVGGRVEDAEGNPAAGGDSASHGRV